MKFVALLLCSAMTALAAAEQSATVASGASTQISLEFTNSAADVNAGAVPYVRGNATETAFNFLEFSGHFFYNVNNIGATVTATVTEANVEIVTPPTLGTAQLGRPEGHFSVSYTPSGTLGADSLTLAFYARNGDGSSGAEIGTRRTLAINVVNSPPTLSIDASPTKLVLGESIAIFPTASDPDGSAVTLSYDYGDGSTGSAASHVYAAAGIYTLTASASDGIDTVSKSISIEVTTDAARIPVARFTTSDVVGFVGQPLGFDAFYSTDPQNAIASFSWDFGDGSPLGTGQAISRAYGAANTYTVTLTIRDAEGIQTSTQRQIEILPADQLGIFNAFIDFKTSFDRTKTAKDSLTLSARMNIGDGKLAANSAVALEIAGKRFAATLDRKLRATVKDAPKQTWKIQFGTRKQSNGQVDLQVSIKNADLGLAFNTLGALPGGDGSATITIPVRLELNSFSIEIPCKIDFDFNAAGTKAKGDSSSD